MAPGAPPAQGSQFGKRPAITGLSASDTGNGRSSVRVTPPALAFEKFQAVAESFELLRCDSAAPLTTNDPSHQAAGLFHRVARCASSLPASPAKPRMVAMRGRRAQAPRLSRPHTGGSRPSPITSPAQPPSAPQSFPPHWRLQIRRGHLRPGGTAAPRLLEHLHLPRRLCPPNYSSAIRTSPAPRLSLESGSAGSRSMGPCSLRFSSAAPGKREGYDPASWSHATGTRLCLPGRRNAVHGTATGKILADA